MYIPHPPQTSQTDHARLLRPRDHGRIVNLDSSRIHWPNAIHDLCQKVSCPAAPLTAGVSQLWKRTTSGEIDTTIGIVVGVLLGVFLIATCAFLYIYRGSIRTKKRKRRGHHRKTSSSKGSKSSDSGGSAAPPAPA